MREIKFRAWGGEEKKYFVHFDVFDERGENYFIDREHNENGARNILHFEHVEAVQQFTGLHDKNGKQIFEGDILGAAKYKQQCAGLACEVTWEDGRPGFVLKDNRKDGEYVLNKWNTDHWEVIGNNYEDPELLANNARA